MGAEENLENEQQVRNIVPDFGKTQLLAPHAVTVTAKGEIVDFVSRYFAPNGGVMEEPVTGASHTRLIPFWAERLKKNTMVAEQLSKRSGVIYCENCGDRVKMLGRAALYLRGEIFVS